MPNVLRAVVMWLIALAIPMQGMAAGVMPPCPQAQHPVAPGATERFADERAGDHAAASGHQDGTALGQSGHSDHGVLKCCSATFSLAAVTTPSVVAQTPLRLPAPLHPLAQQYRDVTLDGLDRPPKLFLA